MNNNISNKQLLFTALGIFSLVASAASAGSAASSDGPTPMPGGVGDPFGNLPFEAALDPDLLHDPFDKDDEPQIPVSYVDIPEIDREPLSSTNPFPDDLFNPLPEPPSPFLNAPIGIPDGFLFQFDFERPGLIDTPIVVQSIPVPSTVVIGGLAVGALLRRRR